MSPSVCCTSSTEASFHTTGTLQAPIILRKLWSSSPYGFGITKVISKSFCSAMPRVKP